MADTPAPAKGSGSFGFLTRKVGPAPIWVWGALGFGAYWWYTRKGPGAKPAAAPVPPQVIEVSGPPGAAGPPGPPGPPAKRRKGRPPRPVPHPMPPPTDQHGPPVVSRGVQPVTPQPVPAVAPMTSGDIYGGVPTSNINGTTYDSGYPSNAELGGAYVPAG